MPRSKTLRSAGETPRRMKWCFALLLAPLLLSADEQRLLLSGFTLHEKHDDRFGEPYNAFNYGLGYEYNFYQEPKRFYFATNVLVLNDSYENLQYTVGAGHYIRFDTLGFQSAVGLSGFIGWKKIYDDSDLDRSGGAYGLTGGIAPALNFYYRSVSVNLMYVPSFHYKEVEVTGFLYTYFSWKLPL